LQNERKSNGVASGKIVFLPSVIVQLTDIRTLRSLSQAGKNE
jgi:hypothetical protein